MSRWGRVLVDRGGAQRQDVFAVSSRAGIFGRALLEDVDGFDAELPAELGDSDLALRGLLMGYRSVAIGGPGVEIASELAFRLEDEAEPQAEAVRAWARGRLRLALKSIPRETWRQAWPAIALELAADVYRAAREQRHAPAVLRGFVDGLRAPARDLSDRKQALGRRRVGDAFVRKAFEVSEEDMAHCTWQRVLRGMVS